MPREELEKISREIVLCERCPRLRQWCARVASEKRRAFQEWDYWGRPVPDFGDPDARMLIVGLAPAAHGANRTGRMFTGDESGNWLYQVLYEAGLACQAESLSRQDGQALHGVYITAAVHCAPPANKPSAEEFGACRAWLVRTLHAVPSWRVILVLGALAFRETLKALRESGVSLPAPAPRFGHGVEIALPDGRCLVCSYHPSQQNTYTGRLTRSMLRSVVERARDLAEAEKESCLTSGNNE